MCVCELVPIWKREISAMKLINLIHYYHSETGEHRTLKILNILAPDWVEVGNILGFKNYELETIRNAGAGTTPVQCLRVVLSKWMERGGEGTYKCNWEGLRNLLKDAMKIAAAKELKIAVEADFSDLRNNYNDGKGRKEKYVVPMCYWLNKKPLL